ncbi:hypothetical protein PCASD_26942 [Puccinia coronata f. sp. avenae]|uniref:Core-binding (CB) domain-containing protein n=1 Tax=Puccinia coronata f. sp. avenae TaxID=200324 RepID=A0A2N5RU55_9BASI|nr:hypothetical protein PCASD_26942 [Puccinia coronata f. sp. avenae]
MPSSPHLIKGHPYLQGRPLPNSDPSVLKLIQAFLHDGLYVRPLSSLDQHALDGWKKNTLVSYNAGIKKFLSFRSTWSLGNFSLPLSSQEVLQFCHWAGRSLIKSENHEVSSKLVQQYVFALKAWHVFHEAKFPNDANSKLSLLFKASGWSDAESDSIKEKEAVKLDHLLFLHRALFNSSAEDKVIFDLMLVAFWGMARLSEITNSAREGILPSSLALFVKDVSLKNVNTIGVRPEAHIYLCHAKTCKPGEVQLIRLKKIGGPLCP